MTSSTPAPAVICVFCGASPGTSDIHLKAARDLAKVLHDANVSLVYGGGTTGIMGEVARTLVSLSGPSSVHGIIPRALVQYERVPGPGDVATENSTNSFLENGGESQYGKTTIVGDMHTRKRMMASTLR